MAEKKKKAPSFLEMLVPGQAAKKALNSATSKMQAAQKQIVKRSKKKDK
jgi:hypothetical protein